MIRAVSLTCLVLFAMGSAPALAKPKIAILGLEVLNPGGASLDAQTTVIAKELTDQLRVRARAGSGKYEIAPNSDKELVDEKLMQSCDTELPSCMAPIGSAIGASWMIYGNIRKEGANYVVGLTLLNVNTKTRERTLPNQLLPTNDAADTVKLGAWAKKRYSTLVDESNLGTVVIEVSTEGADGGTVKIDGEERGTIANGRLPIPNLSDGKHRLVIEVGGFQRFEKDITVAPNDKTSIPVTLTRDPNVKDWKIHEIGGTTSEEAHTNYWRGLFIGGTVVAIVGGAYWGYSWNKETDIANGITHPAHPSGQVMPQSNFSDSLCKGKGSPGEIFPDTTPNNNGETDAQSLTRACNYRTKTIYGIAGFGVGALVMISTFYSAWVKPGNEPHDKLGSRTKKATFAFTPVISPEGGGAALRIDW